MEVLVSFALFNSEFQTNIECYNSTNSLMRKIIFIEHLTLKHHTEIFGWQQNGFELFILIIRF